MQPAEVTLPCRAGEGQWRDLGPDRPRTGSGRNENEMTILAWAVVEYFTDDRMLEGL